MVRKLISWALPLAVVLAITTSAFAAGVPLMKGLKDADELAGLVEKSLKRDAWGNSQLDPDRCQKNGSCATPNHYFTGIRKKHPSAKLESVGELPRYLRSLEKKSAPTGVWQMSRLLVNGEDIRYDDTGWKRPFHKDEVAWTDLNTGETILAGDCGNVVGELVKQVARRVPPPARRFAVIPQLPTRSAPPVAVPSAIYPVFGRVPRAFCPSAGGAPTGIPVKRC